MPDGVAVSPGANLLGRGSIFSGAAACGQLVQDFEKRAGQAFAILSGRDVARAPLISFKAGATQLKRPQGQPNMRKLVGTARTRTVLKSWDTL
jgi:hypothetical protein